jgi:hypothetical protein
MMAFLASPFSSESSGIRYARWVDACVATAQMIRNEPGLVVFSPIAHSAPVAEHGRLNPLDHAIWMPQGQWFLERCDEVRVLMIDGWRQSVGIRQEILLAIKLGKVLGFWKFTDGRIVHVPGFAYEPAAT